MRASPAAGGGGGGGGPRRGGSQRQVAVLLRGVLVALGLQHAQVADVVISGFEDIIFNRRDKRTELDQ